MSAVRWGSFLKGARPAVSPLAPVLPMRSLSRRVLFSMLPASVLLIVGVGVIWGENGLLVRHQLEQQVRGAQRELARIDRENERLLRDLRAMERDPIVMERLVADELQWGSEDAVLVRFTDEQAR